MLEEPRQLEAPGTQIEQRVQSVGGHAVVAGHEPVDGPERAGEEQRRPRVLRGPCEILERPRGRLEVAFLGVGQAGLTGGRPGAPPT